MSEAQRSVLRAISTPHTSAADNDATRRSSPRLWKRNARSPSAMRGSDAPISILLQSARVAALTTVRLPLSARSRPVQPRYYLRQTDSGAASSSELCNQALIPRPTRTALGLFHTPCYAKEMHTLDTSNNAGFTQGHRF